MPSYLVHCKISIELFRKSYYKLHKAIDSAFFVVGRRHRDYFHDDISVIAIARREYPGDEKAVAAAKYHVELDWMCTADPVFRSQLEMWAKTKVHKRSKSKSQKITRAKKKKGKGSTKSKPPVLDEFEQFKRDLEKLIQMKKLAKMLNET